MHLVWFMREDSRTCGTKRAQAQKRHFKHITGNLFRLRKGAEVINQHVAVAGPDHKPVLVGGNAVNGLALGFGI